MINSKLICTLIVILFIPLGTANSSEKLKLPPTVIGKDFGFTEGPVWVSHKEMWLFTDIPKNKIYSLTANGALDVWMEKSEYANGLNIDKENNVWMAHHCRKVSYTTPSGKNKVVASSYNDKKLNSPNDIAIKKDGTVWFTDPMYGITFKGFGVNLRQKNSPCEEFTKLKMGR